MAAIRINAATEIRYSITFLGPTWVTLLTRRCRFGVTLLYFGSDWDNFGSLAWSAWLPFWAGHAKHPETRYFDGVP